MRTRPNVPSLFASVFFLCSSILASAPVYGQDLGKIDSYLGEMSRFVEGQGSPERFLYLLIGVIGTLEARLDQTGPNARIQDRLGQAYLLSTQVKLDEVYTRVSGAGTNPQFPPSLERANIAYEHLSAAAASHTANPETHLLAARASQAARTDRSVTIRHYETAWDAFGSDFPADGLEALILLYNSTGQYQKARAAAESFLRDYPATSQVLRGYIAAAFSLLFRGSQEFPSDHSIVLLPPDYDPEI